MKNSIPDTYTIPNPDYIAINQQHKSIAGKLSKQKQKLADKLIDIDRTENEEKQMTKFLRQKADILQTVEAYKNELETIKLKKKDTPKRIDVKDANPERELLTAINDQKQLIDTIKMIGYRAETSLANQIKPLMSSPEQARNLIRSIYQSNADLKVDKENNRLCVLLHHSNFTANDKVIRKLLNILNKSETVFPGSNLTLFYILMSDIFQK
jgi:DNA-binding transcriptional regulator/RsmH inhibitor MraZ